MANDRLNIILDAEWKGKSAVKNAERDISGLEGATKKGASGFASFAGTAVKVAGVLGTVAYGAKLAYDAVGKGAQLELARKQFDNLAESIGMTGDALLTDMAAASKGMVSQAQLVASGAQIISLGLADTGEGVTRLATAVSTLGLDMQQVIMTFANNSVMRLDALGLSVEDVTKKAEELEAQGFVGDAFDEAVLIALEEKMELLGDTSETTAGKMKQLESDLADLKDGALLAAAAIAGPLVGALADFVAGKDPVADMVTGMKAIARESGSFEEFVQALQEAGDYVPDSGTLRYWYNQQQVIANSAREADRYLTHLERQGAAGRLAANLRGEFRLTEETLAALGMVTEELTYKGDDYAHTLRVIDERTKAAAAAEEERTRRAAELAEVHEQRLNNALEEYASLTRAAADAYQNDFVSALQTGAPTVDTFTDSLLGQLDAIGAGPEIYSAAAVALGEYDKNQIEAATNAAIIQDRIRELAEQFNDGKLSAQELREEMRALADGSYLAKIDVDTSDAERKLGNLRDNLARLSGGAVDRGGQTGTLPEVDIPNRGAPTPTGTKGGGKALGGFVMAGTSYLVGERGPEMFTPATSGNITPNDKLGGSVVIDMRGASFGAGTSSAMIQMAVESALKRAGLTAQARMRV